MNARHRRTERRVWWFGHYDSRGGGFLFSGSLVDALRALTELASTWWQEAWWSVADCERYAEEALQEPSSVPCVFFDQEPPDGGELFHGYEGPFDARFLVSQYGTLHAVVFYEHGLEPPTPSEAWKVLWDQPDHGATYGEWRGDEDPSDVFGEDAWGATWNPEH